MSEERISVTFRHKKETPRMHHYEYSPPNDEPRDIIGNIYISKAKLKGRSVPLKIEVLITATDK